MSNELPLTGLTVVSLEQAVAAPFATRQLADLGARVVKVERPGSGDFARGYDTTVNGMASHFVWLNRGKQSVTLDLKQPAAREALDRLVAGADVLVSNLAPGAVDRLGYGAAQARSRNPRLVWCAISGYGRSGPYRDNKAYDLLIQAESGLLSITGTAEEPAKVGISIADISAGMYAFTGVLTALLGRAQHGRGATIEVSMLEALAEWMGYPLYYSGYGQRTLSRTGLNHAAIAPYGAITAADDRSLIYGLQNDREWKSFCVTAVRQPELADDPRFADNSGRVAHRRELDEAIASAFTGLSSEEIAERFDAAGIAHARMRTVHELLEHEQLTARNRWREIGSPVGPLRALLPPVTVEGLEPSMGDVPALGEHTDTVLGELGYDAAAIRRLRDEGAV
jgi:itaconate CoA-transferase